MDTLRGKLLDNGAFGSAGEAFAAAGLALSAGGGDAGCSFAAISLPPDEAFRESLSALRGGLHVVSLPPFCLSVTEHARILSAAAEAGRTFFPVHPWGRSAALRAVGKALDNGFAGRLRIVSIEAGIRGRTADDPAKSPDLYQAFAELLSAVRRPPTALTARLAAGRAVCCAQFGDIDGLAHIHWNSPATRFRLSAEGDNGVIETDGRSILLQSPGGTQGTDFDPPFFPGTDLTCLAAELRDFRSEMDGRTARGTGVRNSLYCVRLLKNAAYSSSIRSACVPI